MATVAARSFKEQYPQATLTLGINRQFADLLPLFACHPYFDDIHVYETYDGWPGPADRDYLTRASYDLVFHAMPQHQHDWWRYRHQYAEMAFCCGLPIPTDIQPVLTKWFRVDARPDTIAFAPFGGNGGVNDKMLSISQAQQIVDYLVKTGYKVIHLGAADEPALTGAVNPGASYFDSIRIMLGCKALIHCDTGLGHFAGAYNHPSIGLYGYRYFGREFAHQIRPIHSRFLFVEAPTVGEIQLDTVAQLLHTLLR